MTPLYKIKIIDISRLFLFLLIISINIREPFFHTREIFFFLFVVTSLSFANYKNLIFSLLLLSIWGISVVFNLLMPGSNMNLSNGGFETIISSAYLFLLCFSKKEYAETIIKSYLVVSVFVGILIVVLWGVCHAVPFVYTGLKLYFDTLRETKNLMICNIDKRSILGFVFLTVYYRTSPCMIGALGYCLISRLKGIKKYSFQIILFTVALIFTGARANMMSAVLLIFLYVVFCLIKKEYFSLAFMLLILSFFLAVFAAFLFLTDSNSKSTSIKALDTQVYMQTFHSDLLRAVLFGWGPGSSYYSLVRHKMMNVSELSHLETMRRYGFIFTLFIFLFIWFSPFITKLINEESIFKYFYGAVIFAFIFTACTNVFLVDSVGFCALLFFKTFFMYGEKCDDFHCNDYL